MSLIGIDPQTILDILNEALEADPVAINELFSAQAICNNNMLLDHPDICCYEFSTPDRMSDSTQNGHAIRFLGLITGIMSRTYHKARIAAVYDNDVITQFVLLENIE